MNSIFEITRSQIALLNDEDLRSLIGLLSEAEFKSKKLPTSGIVWGGSQDAKDGGIDVSIKSKVPISNSAFISRAITGFQVKKPKMPRSEIIKEMRPKGLLRSSIIEIGKQSGAYIIVSSGESLSPGMLDNRLQAMKESLPPELHDGEIYLDFYDSARIATWVRSYPGLIFWVQHKIGRGLNGWMPYGNWSGAPEHLKDFFVVGSNKRFIDFTANGCPKYSILEGINLLRTIIFKPRSASRLTGLSGVGKTRFVQTLFDSSIGNHALAPHKVVYTDISNAPDPNPLSMLEQLSNNGEEVIVVLDNCNPELHRSAAHICKKEASKISILTIEYDISDDIPEETSVYRLLEDENDNIHKILKQRYTGISDIDSRRISEFSGGNARIAVALASTLNLNESISGLRDDELFKRLFWQRKGNDDTLLRAAEACSLVYSFNAEDFSSDSEMAILSSLADLNTSELHRFISMLKERGLLQERGPWSAILPQAIADRLSHAAMKRIAVPVLMDRLFNGPTRLAISFSKRLSSIHDNQIAIKIANCWFQNQEWTETWATSLNSDSLKMLLNYASVVPHTALEKIALLAERVPDFCSKQSTYSNNVVRLLCQIAYDPESFNKCVDILIRFALIEDPGDNVNSIRKHLKTLFQPYVSGTHASLEQRLFIIRSLVYSGEQIKQELGLLLLNTAIGCGSVTGQYYGHFGARSRDYGAEFQTREDQLTWYMGFCGIFTDLATGNSIISNDARKFLGISLRSLTPIVGINYLEEIVGKVVAKGFWNEGWKGVKDIIGYDCKKMSKSNQIRISKLESDLKPNGLIQQAKAALVQGFEGFISDVNINRMGAVERMKKVGNQVQQIAMDIAEDESILYELSYEICGINSSSYMFHFGSGLAKGSNDLFKTWQILRNIIEDNPKNIGNLGVIRGFIDESANLNENFYNHLLDNIIVYDQFLVKQLPLLQAINSYRESDYDRIFSVLAKNLSDIRSYLGLSFHVANSRLDDNQLSRLIMELAGKQGGASVAVELLSGLFHNSEDKDCKPSQKLIDTVFEFLAKFPFSWKEISTDNLDFQMSEIVSICLLPEYGFQSSDLVCRNVLEKIRNDNFYPRHYRYFINILAKIQPFVFLNTFMTGFEGDNFKVQQIFLNDSAGYSNPITSIRDNDVIFWCDKDPATRFQLILENSIPFAKSNDKELDWKPVTYKALERAPAILSLLKHLYDSLFNTSIILRESKSEILETRMPLLQKLIEHHEEIVGRWAMNQLPKFQKEIEFYKNWEMKDFERQHQSFE